MNFKIPIGAALYTDILKSPSCLSLTLQEEKLDVQKSIQHLLKARKLLQILSKQNMLEWPSVRMVYNRIVEDESSKIHTYQGIALTNCSHEKFQQYLNETIKDLKGLDDKLPEGVINYNFIGMADKMSGQINVSLTLSSHSIVITMLIMV